MSADYPTSHHGSFPDILVTSTPSCAKVMTRSAIYTSLDQPPSAANFHPPLPNCRCSQTMLAARRGLSPEQLTKFQASEPAGAICGRILDKLPSDYSATAERPPYPTSILKRTDSRKVLSSTYRRQSADSESSPLRASQPQNYPINPNNTPSSNPNRRFNVAALSIAGVCFLLFVVVSLVMMYTVIDDVLKKKMG